MNQILFHRDLMLLLLNTVLQRPQAYPWSIQGFGMLRLYLSPQVWLHLWHPLDELTEACPALAPIVEALRRARDDSE